MELAGQKCNAEVALKVYQPFSVLKNWTRFHAIIMSGENSWGEYETIESLQDLISQGYMQTWGLEVEGRLELVALSSMERYNTGRCDLVIHYIMGEGFFTNLAVMKELLTGFKDFARKGNCTALKIYAKPAFSRVLKKDFLEEAHIITLPLCNKERMN